MFIKGMDFSSLEETEKLGGIFRQDGRPADLLAILKANGINGARLRLWADPYDASGRTYGAGGSDLAAVKRLARRAQDCQMAFMLDIHYSDFWCDPGRQMIPKAWQGHSHRQLVDDVAAYTANVIAELNAAGLPPDYIQIGNEITNGMLWPDGQLSEDADKTAGFERLAQLLQAGCQAARNSSAAKLVLHLEASGDNARWRQWFDAITGYGVSFDIIGASYYPYWHGRPEKMASNLDDMADRYGKDTMIVETAYPFTVKPCSTQTKKLVISDGASLYDGTVPPWPVSRPGQQQFVKDMLQTARGIRRCQGLWYWEPGWLPLAGSTWASQEALVYCGETDKTTGNEWANQCLFDYHGCATAALKEFREESSADVRLR